MEVKVGSIGFGYKYGRDFINYILRLSFGNDVVIKPTKDDNCDVVILTHFVQYEKRKEDVSIPCIVWNGESIRRKGSVLRHIDKSFLSTKNYILFSANDEITDCSISVPYGFHVYLSLVNQKLWNLEEKPSNERSSFFAYCISDRRSGNKRIEFLNLFCDKYPNTTTALGRWSHDKSIHKQIPSRWSQEKLKPVVDTYSEYKFVLAAENTIEYGYLTEKIFTALSAGCIPVYIGDSMYAKKILNHKRFVCVDDFESYEDCIDYIVNMTDIQIDNMRKEPIFTNNLESEIFRTLNSENSNINKHIASTVRGLIDVK